MNGRNRARHYTRRQIRQNRTMVTLGVLALLLLVGLGGFALWRSARQGAEVDLPEKNAMMAGDLAPKEEGTPSSDGGTASKLPSEDAKEGELSAGNTPGEDGFHMTEGLVSPSAAADKPSSVPDRTSKVSSVPETIPEPAPAAKGGLPLLVNPTHEIPQDFTADVVELGNGYKFDRVAAPALNRMLEDGRKAGLSLWVISAYRSHESQVRNFNNKISEYKGLGYSEEDAYAATALYIAVPGTSEHSIGLAADLNSLEDRFENTKEFQWLIKNCAEYGFILRYPKDKVEITKIAYEPWHYRYVGVDHARKIMSQNICLEEYIQQAAD